MSRVNIYTRPVDDEVWAWARWLAERERLSVSHVVADALRAYRSKWETVTARAEEER